MAVTVQINCPVGKHGHCPCRAQRRVQLLVQTRIPKGLVMPGRFVHGIVLHCKYNEAAVSSGDGHRAQP